ncbi:MAG: lactate racemase domain-containing protein [Pseudomonadota bacterium]|nr:lactate racemase domain-containing protein [Pseudomonadota bacterium]
MSLAAALQAAPPPTGSRVRIAVPDGTRPLDVGEALAALRPWLTGDVRAIVGLGLHRRMRADELPPSPFPLLQHDPDDTVPTAIVDGIPGGLTRAAADADVLIGLGIVEPHQYAGFSGGHKAVSVGLGARATLDALHHRDRVIAPGVRLGRLPGNPFRAAVDALGEAAGCRWVLLLAGGRWFAGEPRATLAAAAASLDCWEDVPRRHPAAILRVPARKAVNFYQASRAATYLGLSEAPPLDEGATLFLDAACPEGMGEGDGERAFAAVLARGRAPWAGLLDGPAPVGAGTQRAVMIAALARRFRLVVTSVTDPGPLQACGIEATATRAEDLAPADAIVVADAFTRIPRYAGP